MLKKPTKHCRPTIQSPSENTLPLAILEGGEIDYPAVFRKTCHLNRLIELRGATNARLLRRGSLYYALGDYAQSLDDAAQLIQTDPLSGDGHYLLGAASLALALQKIHRLARGPGNPLKKNRQRPRTHLMDARDAFEKAQRLNPRDQEATEALETTNRHLASLPEPGDKRWKRTHKETCTD